MLAGEASMTVGSLFLKACIIVTALAVLLPARIWAKPPAEAWLAGPEGGTEVRVAMAEETRAVAVRAMALADDSREGGTAVRPEEGFRAGTWHLGLMGGYSLWHKVFQNRTADVHFVPLLPQIGYTVTDVHGPFPVRGSLELILEPTFLVTTSPSTTFGVGASLLVRYNFVTGTRWVPFFDLGMGVLHWNLRLPGILGTQFNFMLQGGPGLHFFATDHLAITGQVRLHHISNGGTDSPNIGINSTVYLAGVSYFF